MSYGPKDPLRDQIAQALYNAGLAGHSEDLYRAADAVVAIPAINGLASFALAVVSMERTDDIDALIADTADDVLRSIDPDMVDP